MLKLILEIMCDELPEMNSLKEHSEFLTTEEKSKIFLQALNRVLFAEVNEIAGDGEVMISRPIF